MFALYANSNNGNSPNGHVRSFTTNGTWDTRSTGEREVGSLAAAAMFSPGNDSENDRRARSRRLALARRGLQRPTSRGTHLRNFPCLLVSFFSPLSRHACYTLFRLEVNLGGGYRPVSPADPALWTHRVAETSSAGYCDPLQKVT